MIFQVVHVLEKGFVNLMADKSVGALHITLIGSIRYLIVHIMESISMYLLTYINYEYFIIFGVIYMIIMLLNTKNYAITLDEADPSEFKIKRYDFTSEKLNHTIVNIESRIELEKKPPGEKPFRSVHDETE